VDPVIKDVNDNFRNEVALTGDRRLLGVPPCKMARARAREVCRSWLIVAGKSFWLDTGSQPTLLATRLRTKEQHCRQSLDTEVSTKLLVGLSLNVLDEKSHGGRMDGWMRTLKLSNGGRVKAPTSRRIMQDKSLDARAPKPRHGAWDAGPTLLSAPWSQSYTAPKHDFTRLLKPGTLMQAKKIQALHHPT